MTNGVVVEELNYLKIYITICFYESYFSAKFVMASHIFLFKDE